MYGCANEFARKMMVFVALAWSTGFVFGGTPTYLMPLGEGALSYVQKKTICLPCTICSSVSPVTLV
jgi:hypothetical protein